MRDIYTSILIKLKNVLDTRVSASLKQTRLQQLILQFGRVLTRMII